jgi:hypothetical protein
MATKRPVPLIRYSMDQLPPRTFWKIAVSIPRSEAGSFSENLHSLVHERGGASFYYPNVEQRRTVCRYEWHRPIDGDKYGLRIGIVVDVGDTDISELEAYVTRASIFEDMTAPLEPLSEDVVSSVQEDVVKTLQEVSQRTEPSHAAEFLSVFHIEVPYTYGFTGRFQTSDHRITLLPTRQLKDRNRRVSAAIVAANAGSKEVAKAEAFNDLTIACALFTIANAQRYETTTLNWSRSRPPIQFVTTVDDINENRLYAGRRHWPEVEKMDPHVPERCEWVWISFQKLSPDDRKTYLPALFAYYASKTNKQYLSTLSVVGFTAALGALAMPHRKKCTGGLTCGVCGPLNFKHDLVGEVNAIGEMIATTCDIGEGAKRAELRDMLQRVYRKQRSAFVHGAQFRHEEYGQWPGLPAQMPTNDAPVRELFEYSQDLTSLASITRRTLLQWLASRSGVKIDLERFFIKADRVTSRLMHAIHVTFPEAAVIGFAKSIPEGPGPEA